MAEYERHEGDKEVSIGVRYYISSLGSDAKQFGNAVRTLDSGLKSKNP
ncbi:MAG: hypothetical protein GY749_01630 [Desulfobacteraceae bacterium]|nr:hypothetical protein [Desulfobacteraceae bacterium]